MVACGKPTKNVVSRIVLLSNFVFQFIDLEVGLPVMHHIVVFFSQLPEAFVYFTTHLYSNVLLSLLPLSEGSFWCYSDSWTFSAVCYCLDTSVDWCVRVPCEGRRGQRQRDGGCNVTQIVATASTCNGSTYAKTTDGSQDASWIVPCRKN